MDKYMLKCFTIATGILSEKLWRGAYTLSQEEKINAEEFRIRAGRQFSIVIGGKIKPIFLDGSPVIATREDIEYSIERATKSSVQTYNHQLKNGFISLENGGRMGICGSCIEENGDIRTITDISSLNVRIAKQIFGISSEVLNNINAEKFPSILIISKAGGGKTTFLRDLILRLSKRGIKIGVADERYEIAACNMGMPAFDIGDNTDVISGGDKNKSAQMLIRTMSPQYIAFDEITDEKDAQALIKASYMGASLIATAHCDGISELNKREIYRKILSVEIFDYIVEIRQKESAREMILYRKGEKNDKALGNCDDNRFIRVFGKIHI